MSYNKYVIGFAFNKEKTELVLIKKNTWNGISGKIEKKKTPLQTIIKEFYEKTGVKIKDWAHIINIINDDTKYMLDVYYTFTNKIKECETKDNDFIKIIKINDLKKYKLSENVSWIIEFILTIDDAKYDFKFPIYLDQGLKKC